MSNDDMMDAPASVEELVHNVLLWGSARGLHEPGRLTPQFVKLVEELGELAAAIARNDDAGIRDAAGDFLVVLINFGACHDPENAKTYLRDVLALAWDQIKHRTGKTVDGVFVKDE
jgi:NTP pyrophosphatase (non-canonical NTP hydrolase)